MGMTTRRRASRGESSLSAAPSRNLQAASGEVSRINHGATSSSSSPPPPGWLDGSGAAPPSVTETPFTEGAKLFLSVNKSLCQSN